MRIVVTGTAGVLGSRVAELLRGDHQVSGIDVLQPQHPTVPTAVADLADYAAVEPLLEGADVVVHCAAVHPWKPYTDEQYLRCNVDAVYQVAKACAKWQTGWLVFTSSIAAVGYPGAYSPEEMPIAEDADIRHSDTYSLTKTLAEQVLRSWHRRAGLNVWMLRPPCFIPCDDEKEALRQLISGSRTLPEDMASAHALAATVPPSGVETAYLPAGLPYTPADIALSRTGHTAEVLDRHFPGLTAHCRDHGVELPELQGLFDGTNAAQRLGWRPGHTLAGWWASVSGRGSG